MVRQHDEGYQLGPVASLGPGQGSHDDLVEQGTGPEEESAVDGAAGDLEEGTAFRGVSDLSGHRGAGAVKKLANASPTPLCGLKSLKKQLFGEKGSLSAGQGRVKGFGALGGGLPRKP
jgi:hypothetical protein